MKYLVLVVMLGISQQASCLQKNLSSKHTPSFKHKKLLTVRTDIPREAVPVHPPIHYSMPAQPVRTAPTREEFFSENGELCCCTVGCWICGCSLAITSGLFALTHYIDQKFAHRR